MIFVPFINKFPEVAEQESLIVSILDDGLSIPRGTYCFLESFCDDPKCDCRKVMINVYDIKNPSQLLATIGFGWEKANYYVKWMHGDPLGREMVGAYLDSAGRQTENASKFLEMWQKMILDEEYLERIKKHYKMVKE
jgi:hypothetical protein